MNNNENNFDQLLGILLKRKFNLLKIIIFSLTLSLIYYFSSDKFYESKITLYPAGELSDDSTLMSSIIAQSAGLGELYSPSYYIPDIISSRTLKESIIKNKWYINNNKQNLIEYWNLNINDGLLSFLNKENIDNDEVLLNQAVNILDDLIVIDESSTGLISVYVYNQNSKLASDIANYISDYVIEFVTSQQRKFATQNRAFVETQLDNALKDLSNSEELLTIFRKNNPITLDSPELQLQRARLLRNVEVDQEVYITLRKQYEITKIEESKVRLLVNILDPAKPSIEISHPKFVLILFFAIFIGLLLSIFYLFIIDLLYRKK
mgnify:FL=1